MVLEYEEILRLSEMESLNVGVIDDQVSVLKVINIYHGCNR